MNPEPEEGARGDRTVRSGRLGGVDAARAVAIIGMVMVHFGPIGGPRSPGTIPETLYELPHGRASILFVLIAGVGVALLAGGRAAGWRVRGRLVFRAALLLPLGLWLQGLDHGVLVILQFYALYFLFAALVLSLPDRLLLVTGAGVLLGGSVVYFVGERDAPRYFDGYPATLGDGIPAIAHDLLLSGAYPLALWSAPLLLGIWLGRRLRAPAVRWWLLGLGLAVAGAAPLASAGLTAALRGTGLAGLATDQAHSQAPLWMAGAMGAACAALGGTLLLVERFPRATWPLVATGQLALSVYVVHLLLLHLDEELLRRGEVRAAAVSVAAFVAVAVVSCTLWRAVFSRGPLEAVLAAPWWAFERVFPPRGGRPGDHTRQGRTTSSAPPAERESGRTL